jgi:hypothetical protein
MFDRVVVVDWSANSTPKLGRDSIWIARGDTVTGDVSSLNVATRDEAMVELAAACREPGRTLVGVDFSLGYPRGTALALGLTGVPWREMWAQLGDMVVDHPDNSNNRFVVAAELNRRIGTGVGPFWGCPPSKRADSLTSIKVPADPLPEWRNVEATLRGAGHRPFSSWQLLGAGSVGSQSVLGIAALEHLRRMLGDSLDVWPLSSGLVVPEAPIVVCEVWPTLTPLPALHGRVRDDVQVRTLTALLVERVQAGLLGAWFTPNVDSLDVASVVAEEGWVLGAAVTHGRP